MGNCMSKRSSQEAPYELDFHLDFEPDLSHLLEDEDLRALTLLPSPPHPQSQNAPLPQPQTAPPPQPQDAILTAPHPCEQSHENSPELTDSSNTVNVHIIDGVCNINGQVATPTFMEHVDLLRSMTTLNVYITSRSPHDDWHLQTMNPLLLQVTNIACIIHARIFSIGAEVQPLHTLRLHYSLERIPPTDRPLELYQRPLIHPFQKLSGIEDVEITGLNNDAGYVDSIRQQIMSGVSVPDI